MNVEEFREFCLSKPFVTEHFPFDEVTLVFKVKNKMFAMTGLDSEQFTVNLKCNPDYALELRNEYEDIIPGYHMSKKHWNTVNFEGKLSENFLKDLIDHSYQQTVLSLPKKEQKDFNF